MIAQLSYSYLLIRILLHDHDAPEDSLITKVMRMTEARDGLEVTQDMGMVMVREDTRRRMETVIIRLVDLSTVKMKQGFICQQIDFDEILMRFFSRMRERMARRIQRWWKKVLRRSRTVPILISDWSTTGMKSSDWPLSEQDLIQTVLRKYETLQRQSQSLVYSFADRKSRRYTAIILGIFSHLNSRCSELSVQGSLGELSNFETVSSDTGSAEESSLDLGQFQQTDDQSQKPLMPFLENGQPYQPLGTLARPLTDDQQPLMLGDSSSLSEVQALPALILDTSLETIGDDPETNDDNEDTDNGTFDNEDIVWRTSQYYGIDLVTFK